MDIFIICDTCEKRSIHIVDKIGYNPPCEHCARHIEYKGAYIHICIDCTEKLCLTGIRSNVIEMVKFHDVDTQSKLDSELDIYQKQLILKNYYKNQISKKSNL